MRKAIATFALALLASAALAQSPAGIERSSNPRGFQYDLFLDLDAADVVAGGHATDRDKATKEAGDVPLDSAKHGSVADRRSHQRLVAQLAVGLK